MEQEKLLKGVIPALVTPFNKDGGLNLTVIPEYTGFLLGSKVGGLLVCGASGEYTRLTYNERCQLSEAVISEVAGQAPVIVHVGTKDKAQEAIYLADHAQRSGASAVACTFPGNLDARVEYFTKVFGAVVDLPAYVYWRQEQAPNISMEQFLDEMQHVPNFAGVKFTDTRLPDLTLLIALSGGNLNILTGHDNYFLPGLSVGSDGGIGTNFNYLPGIFGEIYNSYLSGKKVRAAIYQQAATLMISEARKPKSGNVLPATKAILKHVLGINVGLTRNKEEDLDTEQLSHLLKKAHESIILSLYGYPTHKESTRQQVHESDP